MKLTDYYKFDKQPNQNLRTQKVSYKKPEAVKVLELLAYEADRLKYPNIPYIAPRKFRDDTANGLTACITAYLRLKQAFVSQLSNTGLYDAKLGKFRPTTARKGLPYIIATNEGMSLFIEVKIGRDMMSEYQTKIRDEQTASGGLFFVATDFTEFKKWFDNL